MISEFSEGQKIKELMLVMNCTQGVTTSGARYLNITLQDASKQIEGRKWDASEEDIQTFKTGNVVEVEADVIKYRNDIQLKVIKGKVTDTDVDPASFVASAPVSKEELQTRFLAYLDDLKDKDISRIIEAIINENFLSFFNYPAAVRNHHEYVSGLAHHTVSMLDLAKAVCNLYPQLDRQIVYAGVILHDIGKIEELSGPFLPHFTTKGKLVGHISIMQAKIASVSEKLGITSEVPLLLQHMVLSHHGKLEYGSPVLPQTLEAEALSIIDNLDARMNTITKAVEATEDGDNSARIPSLEGRSFYRPLPRNESK